MKWLIPVAACALLIGAAASVVLAASKTTTRDAFTTSFEGPVEVHFIPVDGRLTEAVIDDERGLAYATNADRNRVEVISLATNSLSTPIPVGSLPMGLDITPDAQFLYVANSGGSNVSKVDLTQRQEVTMIDAGSCTLGPCRPFSLAVANNGKALFSTTFAGSGFGGSVKQIDLATDSVGSSIKTVTEVTYLKASGDRSKIIITLGDISSGETVVYDAGTNTTSGKNLDAFITRAASDEDGSRYAVSSFVGAYILNAGLGLEGTVFGNTAGVVLDGAGALGYRVNGSTGKVDSFDATTFQVTKSTNPGDTVASAGIALSGDGLILVVPTQHGVSIIRPFSPATPTPTPSPTPTLPPSPSATPTPTPSVPPAGAGYRQLTVTVRTFNPESDVASADGKINNLAAQGWELIGPPIVVGQSPQGVVLLYTFHRTKHCGKGRCR